MKMKTFTSQGAALASILLLTSSLIACGPDFAPASYLADLRVLAIQASPLEAGPGEQIVLCPVIYLPEDQVVTDQTWTFCPFSLGAQAGYACAVPACEQTFTPQADGSLSSEPLALGLACAGRFAGQELPEGLPAELPETIEMTYTYSIGGSDGTRRDALARIPVYPLGAPNRRNQAPLITRVEIGGQVAVAGQALASVTEGQELLVRVLTDPASMDSYRDASGRDLTEEAIVSVFATAGRFDFDRAAGLDVEVPWKASELEGGQAQAELYVVVRDLRGGQAVAGPFTIPILR